jgi:elongation factor P hydroxylase
VRRLEQVFDNCFLVAENTRLVGGAQEPLYQPASEPGGVHLLHYREDYFASALHEIAHWCIAGSQRRRLPDFGYWYAPEGRSHRQQKAFEAVEVKPQALEWFFSQACGYAFRVSVDNLDPVTGALPDTSAFREQVKTQAEHWQRCGLPARAHTYFMALAAEFNTGLTPGDSVFCAALID